MTTSSPATSNGHRKHADLLQLLQTAMETEQSKDFEGLEAVYTFLEEKFTRDALDTRAPFFVLKYAIESIIFPEMHWSLAGDLLVLLAQAERERQWTVLLANYALGFVEMAGAQWRGRLHEAEAITPADRATLKRMVDKDRSTRIKYRIIVLHICNTHIIYTRAQPRESHAVPTLLSKYFPSPEEADRRSREFAIHEDLSKDEVAERDEFRGGAVEIIKRAAEWDERRRKYFSALNPNFDIFQDHEFSSYTRDFEASFQPALKWDKVVDALRSYVGRVAEMARDRDDILPEALR